MPNLNFRFDLGSLSLNFVATLGSRSGPQPVERLATAARLGAWIAASGLAVAAPQVDDHDLAQATALREALYRLVHDVVHGRPVDDADLALVNATARLVALPTPQLQPGPARGLWTAVAAPLSGAQALAAIARDAIDLLGGAERHLMRECAGHGCDGIYVDRSRGFRRQWCSSAKCGNQVRVERFRERAAEGN